MCVSLCPLPSDLWKGRTQAVEIPKAKMSHPPQSEAVPVRVHTDLHTQRARHFGERVRFPQYPHGLLQPPTSLPLKCHRPVMDCASDSPDSEVDESGSMNGKVPTSKRRRRSRCPQNHESRVEWLCPRLCPWDPSLCQGKKVTREAQG